MLAACFAAMVVVGMAGLAIIAARRDGQSTLALSEGTAECEVGPGRRVSEATAITAKQTVGPESEPETPIEDVLGLEGEDPGAVYYTSRVREAVREGNPAFARELLQQMKELHPASVLVGEAESLVGGR